MKTEPTFVSNESLKKQTVNQSASRSRVVSVIKLIVYIIVLAAICWLLSCIITKEVVIAIGLIIGFILISSIMRFAFSVILTIIKWVVIAAILLMLICFI